MTPTDVPSTRTSAIGSLIGFAVACVVCVALAACGSGGHSTSSAATTAAAGGATPPNAAALVKARVAAAACMRAQGIDIPDPGPSRGSILSVLRILASYPRAKVQSAETACAAQIRQAFPNATSLSPAQRAERLREAVAFSQCMRAHGISFPDPSTAAGNPAGYIQALESLDTNSPAFKAAGKTCSALTLRTTGG
jgi:hypothetical protein